MQQNRRTPPLPLLQTSTKPLHATSASAAPTNNNITTRHQCLCHTQRLCYKQLHCCLHRCTPPTPLLIVKTLHVTNTSAALNASATNNYIAACHLHLCCKNRPSSPRHTAINDDNKAQASPALVLPPSIGHETTSKGGAYKQAHPASSPLSCSHQDQ